MKRARILALGLLLIEGSAAFIWAQKRHKPTKEEQEDAQITAAVWSKFKDSPQMVDSCARRIAYDLTSDPKFNPRTDWPAYCNDFRDTEIVRGRAKQIREALASLDASKDEKDKIRKGEIWLGATPAMAKLAWGDPVKINRTTTAAGTSEQWVYGLSSYLYFANGRLTAIQDERK